MRKYYVIILCCLCLLCFEEKLTAQEYNDTIVTIDAPKEDTEETGVIYEEENGSGKPNSDTYERQYMDESKLEALRNKKEFQYRDMDSLAAEDYSLQREESGSGTTTSTPGFNANILLWLIVAIVVVIVILQLAGVNMRQLFSPNRPLKTPVEGDFLSENIHEIQYESAIQQAIAAKNFSLATRLMYLQSLKLLSDKNYITWHENKTNWNYVYELKNEKLRNSFRNITYIFEYVQYGHMSISEDKFGVVKDAFSNFKLNVI